MNMNRWTKVAIVLAGYAVALVASVGFVALYDRHFTSADNQTMGGMIAGAEFMYGTGVFLLIGLVPTSLALWWLRKSRAAWAWFTGLGLAFAFSGFASVVVTLTLREPPRALPAVLASVFGVAQMLGSPLWVGGFGLFALLAPARDLRRGLLIAAGVEVAVAACAIVHFVHR